MGTLGPSLTVSVVFMKKKLLFIYNPKAGKAQIKNKLSEILDLFTTAGY